MTKKQAKTGPLHRISSDDFIFAQEVLSIAALIGLPYEQTQRKAVIRLIPTVYVLREKMGFTFKQITALCNRCGFTLAESTIRVYYSQLLPLLQKECDVMMQEFSLLAAEKQLTQIDQYKLRE